MAAAITCPVRIFTDRRSPQATDRPQPRGIAALPALNREASFEFPGGENVALRMVDNEVNGVTVLEIEGRIVLGEESNAFREKVKSLLAAGKKKIVLNMAQVGYIDSAGLGTLVATFHSARSQGAVLKLANLGAKFKEVLQVTKLMTVFDTYDSETAAIQSFGA